MKSLEIRYHPSYGWSVAYDEVVLTASHRTLVGALWAAWRASRGR